MSREKRIVGLIIAGIAALIGLIGSAVASGMALSREIHTAHQVNQLAKNVSLALGTQESLDEKIESRLNALYDPVQFLGDKVQGLQIKHLCNAMLGSDGFVSLKRFGTVLSIPGQRLELISRELGTITMPL